MRQALRPCFHVHTRPNTCRRASVVFCVLSGLILGFDMWCVRLAPMALRLPSILGPLRLALSDPAKFLLKINLYPWRRVF